jgi:hypothetical protein
MLPVYYYHKNNEGNRGDGRRKELRKGQAKTSSTQEKKEKYRKISMQFGF